MTAGGLPHSEIAGSKVVSTYPTLIAGNHVLHRLLVPRHPSCALSNLTKNLIDSGECSGASIRLCLLNRAENVSGQLQRVVPSIPLVRASGVLAPLLTQLFLFVKEQIIDNRRLSIGCGANRGRTGNLLVANQALSQLSYSPVVTDSVSLKLWA